MGTNIEWPFPFISLKTSVAITVSHTKRHLWAKKFFLYIWTLVLPLKSLNVFWTVSEKTLLIYINFIRTLKYFGHATRHTCLRENSYLGDGGSEKEEGEGQQQVGWTGHCKSYRTAIADSTCERWARPENMDFEKRISVWVKWRKLILEPQIQIWKPWAARGII